MLYISRCKYDVPFSDNATTRNVFRKKITVLLPLTKRLFLSRVAKHFVIFYTILCKSNMVECCYLTTNQLTCKLPTYYMSRAHIRLPDGISLKQNLLSTFSYYGMIWYYLKKCISIKNSSAEVIHFLVVLIHFRLYIKFL